MLIEFSTTDRVALEYFPPLPASKVLPDWYKEMPRLHEPYEQMTAHLASKYGNKAPQTIKGCVPVQDFLTSGYVIRSCADIAITPDNESDPSGWWWSSGKSMCATHEHNQCPVSISGKKHNYIKINNVWRVKTPPGYSCYYYQPDFLGDKKLKLFSGIVDSDAYTNPVLFPGVVLGNDSFVINAGDPLMVVFPFKRGDWEHTLSLCEDDSESVISRIMERAYQKLFHKQKRYR